MHLGLQQEQRNLFALPLGVEESPHLNIFCWKDKFFHREKNKTKQNKWFSFLLIIFRVPKLEPKPVPGVLAGLSSGFSCSGMHSLV